MVFLKRQVPVFIAVFVGLALVAQFYVPSQTSEGLLLTLSNWDRIIAAFAIVLGLQSLIHIHSNKVKRKVVGWGYSMMVFAGMLITVFFGLIHELQELVNWMFGSSVNFTSALGTWNELAPEGTSYKWIYNNIFVPCSASMFSILAFFIASAAYRTFRARTQEAAILLLAALIVMLGRVPIGSLIYDQIPSWADWIMSVPNMSAKRGILLGVSLGMIATSLRIVLGMERSYLGGGSEE